jgi:peptidyl-prolyl cis-trans isomerase C
MLAGGEAQQQRRPFVSAASRWLREPLLHFLLLGAVLFGAYSYFKPQAGGPEASMQISLTPDELLQLILVFQAQWQRPPTQAEFSRLVENKVQEEVLYREAVAMGLDKDDTIVKRRMTQKMQFLAEDVAAAYEPTTAELEAWYAKNDDKFALPGSTSVTCTFRRTGAASERATTPALRWQSWPASQWTPGSPRPWAIRS